MTYKPQNPFIVGRYVSPEFFCDRIEETATLTKHLTNGRNVALISPRRMGKSGLIEHTFQQPQLQEQYYTFFIDIYGTRSFSEMIYLFANNIYNQLKPRNTQWKERFFQVIRSLQVGVKFDNLSGVPTLDLSLGDITAPKTTLEEIFSYIDTADKPCLIAFDEFQQISKYRDETAVEAILRTHIQHCHNAQFIFAGSKRHMMSQMFLSPTKPFYQSTIIMGLEPIPLDTYTEFAQRLFHKAGKEVESRVVEAVYHRFDGISWFIQMMMNELFAITPAGVCCTTEAIEVAFLNIVESQQMAFRELMDKVPTKQKQLLQAIAKAGKAQNITSSEFIKCYNLPSASSVQSAAKALLADDLITQTDGIYSIYDRFLAAWICQNY